MHLLKQRSENKLGLPLWGSLMITGISLAIGSTLNASPACAQAAYGSYIGAGPAFGVTKGNAPDEGANTSGSFAVRYKFLTAPISIRTQVLVGGSGVAIVPTVSYDLPISWQADAYVGAGASVVRGSGASPVGNRSAFVVQPGIDYALPNSNLMLYGNAIISFGGYQSNNGVAASLQAGAGLRF